jgi:hypothetical protein
MEDIKRSTTYVTRNGHVTRIHTEVFECSGKSYTGDIKERHAVRWHPNGKVLLSDSNLNNSLDLVAEWGAFESWLEDNDINWDNLNQPGRAEAVDSHLIWLKDEADVAAFCKEQGGYDYEVYSEEGKAQWRDKYMASLGLVKSEDDHATVTLRLPASCAGMVEKLGEEKVTLILQAAADNMLRDLSRAMAADPLKEAIEQLRDTIVTLNETAHSVVGNMQSASKALMTHAAPDLTDDDYIHAALELERFGSRLTNTGSGFNAALGYTYINLAKAYYAADSGNQRLLRDEFDKVLRRFHSVYTLGK